MHNKRLFCQFKNLRSPQQKGEKILLSTLSTLKKLSGNPQGAILTAIKNLRPGVKVITQVKSGKVIPLPAYQREQSANYFAIRWLYKAAQDKTSKAFRVQDLVDEIFDTLHQKGRAFKSKLDLVKEIRESRVNLRKSYRKFKKFQRKRVTPKIWNHKTRKWEDLIQKKSFSRLNPYKEDPKDSPANLLESYAMHYPKRKKIKNKI